ncbi:MAG: cupredoxin domain-containing protein [Rickettsiales bacterium]|nr:cupredoxin domain-containing protein [Rickettsiales bacterium]
MKKFITALAFIFIALQALAEEKTQEKEFLIQIKNNKFEPAIIEVAPNQKFKLIIENLDKTLEEFESNDLKKEKLIGAGKKVTIIIAPLKSGEYKFFGDFHQKTAQGKIIVK